MSGWLSQVLYYLLAVLCTFARCFLELTQKSLCLEEPLNRAGNVELFVDSLDSLVIDIIVKSNVFIGAFGSMILIIIHVKST